LRILILPRGVVIPAQRSASRTRTAQSLATTMNKALQGKARFSR
jgi:hypothetical protein